MYKHIKIAVADNHAGYREAMAEFLISKGFTVVSVSRVDMAFAEQPGTTLPDIAIVGCSRLYPGDLQVIYRLKGRYPDIKVLANVLFEHYLPLAALAEARADGWMIKAKAEPDWIVKKILDQLES